MKIRMSIVTLCCLLTAPVLAQINKWVDDQGKVHYGDRPPQNRDATTLRAPKPPVNGEPVTRRADPVTDNSSSRQNSSTPATTAVKKESTIDKMMNADRGQKRREHLIAQCKQNRGADCESPQAIKQLERMDTPLTPQQRAALRNPQMRDFCSRNPNAQGC